MVPTPNRGYPLDLPNVTGKLDRSISELIWIAGNIELYDQVDRQTLKHHVEDMEAACKRIRGALVPVPAGDTS